MVMLLGAVDAWSVFAVIATLTAIPANVSTKVHLPRILEFPMFARAVDAHTLC